VWPTATFGGTGRRLSVEMSLGVLIALAGEKCQTGGSGESSAIDLNVLGEAVVADRVYVV
jgi:hypothetical protein